MTPEPPLPPAGRDTLFLLLSESKLPLNAQLAAVDNPELSDLLAINDHLHPDVWHQLFARPGLKTAEVNTLVARPLNDDQIATVLRTERRKGPLTHLVDHNQLNVGHVHQLVAHKQGAAVLDVAVTRFAHAETRWLHQVAGTPNASWATLVLAARGALNEAAVADLIPAWDRTGTVRNWTHRRTKRVVAAAVIHRYPQLLNQFADRTVSPELFSAACGSHQLSTSEESRAHIFDVLNASVVEAAPRSPDTFFDGMAFFYNPAVPTSELNEFKAVLNQTLGTVQQREAANPTGLDRRGSLNLDDSYRTAVDAVLEWLIVCHNRLSRTEPSRRYPDRRAAEIRQPVTALDDPLGIEWVLTRIDPTRTNNLLSAGRVVELGAIGANPALNDTQRKNVHRWRESYVGELVTIGCLPPARLPDTGRYGGDRLPEAVAYAAKQISTVEQWKAFYELLATGDDLLFADLVTAASMF